MSIEVIGLGRVSRRFLRMSNAVRDRAALERIGNYFVTKIKKRTSEGRDVEGRFFAPYSAKYKMFRERRGLPVDRPDLFFTGAMLNSLTYKASNQEVKIFFAPGKDRSGVDNPAKAFYNQQKRKFFGIAAGDEERSLDIYREGIKESMRG